MRKAPGVRQDGSPLLIVAFGPLAVSPEFQKWGTVLRLPNFTNGFGGVRPEFPAENETGQIGQLCLGMGAIRPVAEDDFETVYEIVDDVAQVCRGILPADRRREPHMSLKICKNRIVRNELQNRVCTGIHRFSENSVV